MKLYRLQRDWEMGTELRFGYFTPSLRGTSRPVGRPCPLGAKCPFGAVEWRRTRPAHVAYTGGPVGDFISADGHLVARREVAEELASRFTQIQPTPLTVSEPKRGEAVRYKGPELLELHVSFRVAFNPSISSLTLRTCCQGCGRVDYDVEGVELPRREVKIGDRWEMVNREPRKPGQGVILFEEDLDGRDFFTYGRWLPLCTERAKDYIEDRGWTNVSFTEYGEVVPEDWVPPWPLTPAPTAVAAGREYAHSERFRLLFEAGSVPRTLNELRRCEVVLPKLEPDDSKGSPVSVKDIRTYVEAESAGLTAEGLMFVRTADIEDVCYWLWEIGSEPDREYVFVEQYLDTVLLSLEDADALTPEQFLVREYLRDHHNVDLT